MRVVFLKRTELRFEPGECAVIIDETALPFAAKGAVTRVAGDRECCLSEVTFVEPCLLRFEADELAEIGEGRARTLIARRHAVARPKDPKGATTKTVGEAGSEASSAEPPQAQQVPAHDAPPAASPADEAKASADEAAPTMPAMPPAGGASGPERGPGSARGGAKKKKAAKPVHVGADAPRRARKGPPVE